MLRERRYDRMPRVRQLSQRSARWMRWCISSARIATRSTGCRRPSWPPMTLGRALRRVPRAAVRRPPGGARRRPLRAPSRQERGAVADRLLGRMVRPVPHDGAGIRARRRYPRTEDAAGEGECRHGAGAGNAVPGAQHPDDHAGIRRPRGGTRRRGARRRSSSIGRAPSSAARRKPRADGARKRSKTVALRRRTRQHGG